jgi:hypothetical protein
MLHKFTDSDHCPAYGPSIFAQLSSPTLLIRIYTVNFVSKSAILPNFTDEESSYFFIVMTTPSVP